MTGSNDVADDLLYQKATELYGNRGYKMMTDTQYINIKPYQVPVFAEQEESRCNKDLDVLIGEVIVAQRTSDRHIVFVLNLKETDDTALNDRVNNIYDLWHDSAHIVYLENTPSN